MIQISDGKLDLTFDMVNSFASPSKFLLYFKTLFESGAPNTSKLQISLELMAMLRSQAEGKQPKSKVQNTYFLMSSWLTAQKQLNPFTSFRHSQTYDLNQLEMPIMVRLMLSVSDALARKSCSFSMLLSQTSVSMTIRFQHPVNLFAPIHPFSKAIAIQKPDLIVVPPFTFILSSLSKMFFGILIAKVGSSIISAQSLKVIIPTLSVGLNLEMNILMASTDRDSLDLLLMPILYPPSPPPIEPDMSRQIRECKGRPSLSAPSLQPLRKRAKQSFVWLSKALSGN